MCTDGLFCRDNDFLQRSVGFRDWTTLGAEAVLRCSGLLFERSDALLSGAAGADP